MNDADILLRAHLEASELRHILEDVVNPALASGIAKLDKNLELLEATREFIGVDIVQDVQEALEEARRLHHSFIIRLDQIKTRLGVVNRAVGESQRLTQQARDKVGGAAEDLGEAIGMAQHHVNLTASAATVEGGFEYLIAGDRERIKRLIRAAGAEVFQEILGEVENERNK